jgi:hypothetical protein
MKLIAQAAREIFEVPHDGRTLSDGRVIGVFAPVRETTADASAFAQQCAEQVGHHAHEEDDVHRPGEGRRAFGP